MPGPDVYGLFGFPVHHSWSPFIHGMFAQQTGQDIVYRLYESPPDAFRRNVLEFFAQHGRGANVTVPHKRAAAELVNQLSPRAALADAVNTIVHVDGELTGDNTDGAGLLADLTQNLQLDLAGRRILLLGAGGAARGALGALLAARPALLVLAEEFAQLGAVMGAAIGSINTPRAFDLIINATSASLQGDVPAIAASAV